MKTFEMSENDVTEMVDKVMNEARKKRSEISNTYRKRPLFRSAFCSESMLRVNQCCALRYVQQLSCQDMRS
jgi:hypothetical protein